MEECVEATRRAVGRSNAAVRVCRSGRAKRNARRAPQEAAQGRSLVKAFRTVAENGRPRGLLGALLRAHIVVGLQGRKPVATQSKAEHWRSRAAEALVVAEGMTHAPTKATMLRIAAGYERMATQAEEYDPALRAIGEPEKPAKS